MKYTTKLVLIPGTHASGIDASGIDASAQSRSWQGKRSRVLMVPDFPTVNGTGVSAGGCRT